MSRPGLLLVCVVLVLAGAAPARERPIRVRLTPFDVAPGADRIPCEYLALPNAAPMDVRRIVVRASPGLHHVLLYSYLGRDRDPRHLTRGIREGDDCGRIGPADRHRRSGGLLGAVRGGAYDLPEGYAVSILPGQPVLASTHYFNPLRRTRRAAVRLKLVPAEPGTVRHHLQQLDVVAESLELPPRSVTTRTFDFVAPETLNVAMLSSHQHRLGTRATIRPVVDGVEGALVYENRRWAEPPLRWLAPPLRLRAGDRLRIRCEWHNTSDATIRHGDAASHEMCNLNGYVFRDVDAPPESRAGVGGVLVPVPE